MNLSFPFYILKSKSFFTVIHKIIIIIHPSLSSNQRYRNENSFKKKITRRIFRKMKLPVFTKISTRSPPPLPSSVYKRSAGNGGQRCSFGLAGSSPSNLRLAPSLCTSSSSPCSHSARSQSHVAPTSGEFLLPS